MLINLRNALMTGKRLPYDAEVEYLESTGTQWIDTGVYWSLGDSLKIVTAQTQVVDQAAFGVAGKIYGFCTGLGGNSSRTFYWGNAPYAGGGTYVLPTAYGTAIHTITIGTDYCDVDGTSVAATSSAIDTSDSLHTVVLFSRADNTATTRLNKTYNGRIYSFQYWKNGVLVRDFIPVRRGTVGYLYDRVSGKLFGNEGSGDFVLGPDVVPVEYIESHGTEYIDTGLVGRDGYDFEYRFRPIGPLPLGIGGEYESNKNCYIGLVRSNGYLAYNYYLPNDIVQVQQLTLGTDYNIKAHLYSGEQYFEVNGVRGGVGSRTGTFTSSYNLYLFAINSANKPTNFGVMRLYNLTAHLNTIPVRSFRPVRVGTEGAMMDTLTRRIYRNAGTGAFTYGNDLKYPIPAE